MFHKPYGKAEIVLNNAVWHSFYCVRHSVHEKDRMMNPDIDYPVAFSFGDRDFFGSDGAELIVKANRHFESGRSQLFKVENSGHDLEWDNPYKLVEQMIGFFEGTITSTFEPKPRDEWVAPNPALTKLPQ